MSLKFCACVQVHSSGLANIGNIIQDPYLLHGNGLTHFDFCGTGCELFASVRSMVAIMYQLALYTFKDPYRPPRNAQDYVLHPLFI